ncbi:hypothetical protein JQ604_28705 [Bradyrhizobium jicamae]|uniref:hypothetical protein n=1 Tax=Bradyrhizobium jicamae TaxID=280332 RepID=UPI001BA96F83|nr:hypothetical protein [Bradyrhizobium jicamae]MBR0756175.1 hypothetical protein [Bradyrhizobium jicamae]
MSAETATVARDRHSILGQVPAWFWVGSGVYALLLLNGVRLLADSDTYWQISVGQWIFDHRALPTVDIYSFTRTGEPWLSSSWLAQVLYATAYDLAGWTGPVVLAAASVAGAFALLNHILGRRMPATHACVVTLAALVLSVQHLLARPHVLVMPVMIAWAYGLMSASERRVMPSLWLLPVIALWANLHGGFVFGLVLVGGFALDALWNAERSQRIATALRWAAFGIAALIACCATPYGWNSILASRKILDLGELLHLIYEWMPADFSHLSAFELAVLTLIGGALYGGVKLSPPRIALVLGLLHMALSHVRNTEIFALLLPIVVLTPVTAQFSLQPGKLVKLKPVVALVLVGLLGAWTSVLAASQPIAPPQVQSPAAAVDALMARNPKRIFNDLPFGGYLIWRQIPVFIDGRAELYGEKFEMDYFRAVQLKDVDGLLDMLKRHDIDAVILTPATPAVKLLDHIGGWQRIYADESAVVHVRVAN